jgi:hypothetical protein
MDLQRLCFLGLRMILKIARNLFRAQMTLSTKFSTAARVRERKQKGFSGNPQVGKNRGFARFYFTVTQHENKALGSDSSRAS